MEGVHQTNQHCLIYKTQRKLNIEGLWLFSLSFWSDLIELMDRIQIPASLFHLARWKNSLKESTPTAKHPPILRFLCSAFPIDYPSQCFKLTHPGGAVVSLTERLLGSWIELTRYVMNIMHHFVSINQSATWCHFCFVLVIITFSCWKMSVVAILLP